MTDLQSAFVLGFVLAVAGGVAWWAAGVWVRMAVGWWVRRRSG